MVRGSRKTTAAAGMGHNSGVMQEEAFKSPYEAIAAAESLAKSASGTKSAAFKDFEAAGGNKEALRLAMKLRTKSPYEQKKFIRDALLYARYMDLSVGTSTPLETIIAIARDVDQASSEADGVMDKAGAGGEANAEAGQTIN